ncbi:MAG: IS200/IS605 family transposase [Bacteroidales bacterium]|nr:IS200/IS605 family transposase [Bacteroidales bacterium]
MSYTQLIYHIIIRTKYSKKTIPNENAEELYKYITGFVKNKKSIMLQINGTPNHIHMLVSLHPTLSLSNFVKELKNSTNYWIKQQEEFKDFESWGTKYAAFTTNINDKKRLIDYIQNQRTHHGKTSFEEEYINLIKEAQIEIDTNYFLKDKD